MCLLRLNLDNWLKKVKGFLRLSSVVPSIAFQIEANILCFEANFEAVIASNGWMRQESLLQWHVQTFNTLRPRQNGRLFADDTFKCIFLNENIRISTKNSLKFVPKALINNMPALVLIMAWRRPGDKPLSEPMLVRSLTHICVTRPQWVKGFWSLETELYPIKLIVQFDALLNFKYGDFLYVTASLLLLFYKALTGTHNDKYCSLHHLSKHCLKQYFIRCLCLHMHQTHKDTLQIKMNMLYIQNLASKYAHFHIQMDQK